MILNNILKYANIGGNCNIINYLELIIYINYLFPRLYYNYLLTELMLILDHL